MYTSMLNFILFLQSHSSPVLDAFLTVFNMLSQQYFLVLLVAVIYWVLDKRKGEHIAASLIFAVCLSCGIKGAFSIDRPFVQDSRVNALNHHTAPGYSFPSADSAAAASVAATVSTWTKKPSFWTLLTVYTLLIGFCRMYFGLHFPSDVAVGYIIGAFISYLIGYAMKKLESMSIFYGVSALILLSFAFSPNQQKDYYNSIGLMLGAVVGILIEHRFVHFDYNISASRKALRLIFGLLGLIVLALFCHFFLPETHLFFVLDKFVLTFFATGIYPIIFKKLKF